MKVKAFFYLYKPVFAYGNSIFGEIDIDTFGRHYMVLLEETAEMLVFLF